MIAIVGGEDGSYMVDRPLDHWTADMSGGTVHEIVEHNFQELELAMGYQTGYSMSGHRNHNKAHSSV
jgi:hypothetical protein